MVDYTREDVIADVTSLNSLLHIPKTQGNFNCAGSFATILLSGLKNNGYQIKTLTKHNKYEDLLTVSKNGQTHSLIINGEDSFDKILKRLLQEELKLKKQD